MLSWITSELVENVKASQAEFPNLSPYSAAWAWLGKHLPPWLTPRDKAIALHAYKGATEESE